MKPDDWLNRKEAAAYLRTLGVRFSAKTLAKKAANNNAGNGPPFKQFGWRSVSYRRSDLEAWADRVGKDVQ